MGESTYSSVAVRPAGQLRPERLAWGVLLLAFALFCLVCISSTVGAHFFFFQSTVPMESLLRVSRGSVDITTRSDPIARPVRSDSRELFSGSTVTTDNQSQATLVYRDGVRNDQLIATVTLLRNTSLRMNVALRPRFDWSTSTYYLELNNLIGGVDVFIPEFLPRDFQLDIFTASGGWVALKNSGHYQIRATESQIRVMNSDGQAILFSPNHQVNKDIPQGVQGTYDVNSGVISLQPSFEPLLANSSFEELRMPDSFGQTQPVNWDCSNNQNSLPTGAFRTEIFDGRLALRLVRAENASSHGETRCFQAFQPAQSGLDVRGYSYLALRTTFLVKYQSLNACGIEGSECPLMVKMDYLDVNNARQTWIHGFYSYLEPGKDDPLRCNTCAENHDNIYSGTWYTYSSGNLLTTLPAELRPSSILNVTFYASGHQYDVYISDMSLLGGQAEN